MTPRQRCELLLFAACFVAFAYFNQGGGWNQNGRFAEVRAMVEEGRFAINDYLVYQRDPASGDLVRCPVRETAYQWEGFQNRLCWVGQDWDDFTPLTDRPLQEGERKVALVEECCSGDIGYVAEKDAFHPNKPPGTSFFALPGYFLLYHAERWLGCHPDHWWTLEVNAWLTSLLSVGLAASIGTVLLFRVACELSGNNRVAAFAVALASAFGTTFFPFATLLFDHALTASLLVATFYFLRQPRGGYAAGLCAGFAVLTNYVAALAVVIMGLYVLLGRRELRRTVGYILGGVAPAGLLLWYNWRCYGHPFALSNDFQNTLFQDDKLLFGMFLKPTTAQDWFSLWYVAKLLVYSPFRGVFWFCPVLVLGLSGFLFWVMRAGRRAEALACLAIFGAFFLVNVFFNGYHAGFSAGPRYLVPGMPFLALLALPAFVYVRWLAYPLAVLSVGINFLLTATDAQNPVGVGGHARLEGQHPDETYDLVREYAWPLFATGHAWPLLHAQIEAELDRLEAPADDAGLKELDRAQRRAETREELVEGILRGEQGAEMPVRSSPLLLGSIVGPVSVNPIGVYEGLFEYHYFAPESPPALWASFNVGELLWPRSRWSLLPLLLLSGGAAAWGWREAGRAGRSPLA